MDKRYLKSWNYKKQEKLQPKKHLDSYTYFVKYNDAIALIEDIYPYLIINAKKERAKLILEKYKEVTPRNGRYSYEKTLD